MPKYKEYICMVDPDGWYAPVVGEEMVRCKDCKRFDRYTTAPKKYQHDGFCQWWARDTYEDYWCCGGKRKE